MSPLTDDLKKKRSSNESFWLIGQPDIKLKEVKGDMRTWHTSRPCERTAKSHINFCVFDSTWEASEAFQLDHNDNVAAWVKNDHLGFEIVYIFKGIVRKYRPDFIVKLSSGGHLILEVKGEDSQEAQTKREFLDEWVKAVNQQGGFGRWVSAVSKAQADIPQIIANAVH